MALAAGTVLLERFRLERQLGAGGMGVVWAATHLITQKQIALKFMLVTTPELTERFVREARSAGVVRHPNVVDIQDVLRLPDGTPVMVMEMLEGESLADKLDREARFSPSDAALIMAPIVSAIAAAHSVGIVHRDLKPENIFIANYPGREMVPKVLDFGIAKFMPSNTELADTALTHSGAMLGTPYYMSPEQAFGETNIDGRSDVWALGVILYYMLSGQRPFNGDNFGQLVKSITSSQLPPISTVAPWVPALLSEVMERMLRVDRAARLQDLREVELALLECTGLSTPSIPMARQSSAASAFASVTPSPHSRIVSRPSWPRARLLGGGGALLAALAVVAGLIVRSSHSPSPATTDMPPVGATMATVTTSIPVPTAAPSASAASTAPESAPSVVPAASHHSRVVIAPRARPSASASASPSPAIPSATAPPRSQTQGGLSTAVPF